MRAALRPLAVALLPLSAACTDAGSPAASPPAASPPAASPPAAAPAVSPVPASPASPGATGAAASDPRSARAAEAVAALKGAILGELQKALADKGAAGAIDVCGAAAARAKEGLTKPDLAIGRTSSKLRNPANTAPAWTAEVLAALEKAPADARKPATVALPDGGLGYAEPLVIAPLCTQCHGATLADDVKAALAAKYPADQATGYAVGDLRGLVWVEIKTGG